MTSKRNETFEGGLPQVYLLLEHDMVVASDIKDILETVQSCCVKVVHSAADAVKVLAQEPNVAIAILEMRLPDFEHSTLREQLDKHGAEIVLTAGEDYRAEAEANGWHMLLRPFTDKMLEQLLALIARNQRIADS